MPAKFSYDFGDEYFAFAGLQFAFRVITLENAYGPCPEDVRMTEAEDGLEIEAEVFQYAGGQRRCPGYLKARIFKQDGTLRFRVTEARHQHPIKGITILIRGLAAPVEEEKVSDWPDQHLVEPFPIIDTVDGGTAAVMPASVTTRKRRWCVYSEYSGNVVLNLSEDQEYVTRSESITGTEWRLDRDRTDEDLFEEWYGMLERDRGLKKWEEREDVPSWLNKVSLFLNLHCEAWTGYVFNTFERQLQILKWIGSFIDGERVLVLLPGWDGRYYWNYPFYEPSPECGGEEGLKKLVGGAHELGMHIAPMYGVVASNYKNTTKLGLEKAACKMAYGMQETCDWTDWDEDLANDPVWQPLNVGDPKFRKHLLGRISDITDKFGMDGVALDISTWLPKDPNNDLFAGMQTLVSELQKRHEDLLVFGENGTAIHLPLFPLFQNMASLSPDHPFHRYCKTTAHLFSGAPGKGANGCFESGQAPYFRPNPDSKTIPTLAIVDDTLPDHADEVEAVIEASKAWAKKHLQS